MEQVARNGKKRPLVLLLGGDRYVLEACARRGMDAVVICGFRSWDNGLVRIPRSFTVLHVEDQSSPEAILSALHRAGLADLAFDGVQTTDEWSLVTAALLGQYLGCGSMDPGTAVYFRDKSLQKRRVAEAGIRVTRVTVLEDIQDISALRELPYKRAVLKPIAGAAAARTSMVESRDDLAELSRGYSLESGAERTFVLEEHVAGDEWCADGIMFDGELLFCALGAYGNTCLNTIRRNIPFSICRLDSEWDSWAYDRALPVVRRALAALGLRRSVFHMELFHDRETGRLTFSECAARRGGVFIHEEVQAKYNVHLAESALLCALGQRPDLEVRRRPQAIGETHLLGRPGILVHCPTPAELMKLPGVEFARIAKPYGTRIPDGVHSTSQYVGEVLVAAESEEQLFRRFDEVRSWFDEHLVVMPEEMHPRGLREWQRRTWPDADFGDTLWSELPWPLR
jgi:biotin carboxylase